MVSFNPKRAFAFGTNTFDSSHRFETSWLISPWWLFGIRALFALYIFFILIFNLVYLSLNPQYGSQTLSFSYFTILTYWGLGFYFLLASIHTLTYARSGTPLLTSFPRPLQALHSLFHTTITTYPFLVTIIYWGVLFQNWWRDDYNQFSNISQHALNAFFALFEIFIPRTNPAPWIHLIYLILILGAYLGLAYLTHATRGVYVYSFLDPAKGEGMVVAYVFGILAGIIIIFIVRQLLVKGRKWVTESKMGREGKFHGGRSKNQGDVEFQDLRHWEK